MEVHLEVMLDSKENILNYLLLFTAVVRRVPEPPRVSAVILATDKKSLAVLVLLAVSLVDLTQAVTVLLAAAMATPGAVS